MIFWRQHGVDRMTNDQTALMIKLELEMQEEVTSEGVAGGDIVVFLLTTPTRTGPVNFNSGW